MRRLLSATLALAALGSARATLAMPAQSTSPVDREHATEPGIYPTPLWALLQLVPSPEWQFRDTGVRFGARWQVTPLLYSFGINRKLSPWRTLIAEPLVRNSGSVELVILPEYLAGGGGSFADHWVFRGGLRATFPLLAKGETLSASIGGSALSYQGRTGAAYEAGIYTLNGFFGLQLTYCPTPALRSTTLTLAVRVF